MIWLDALYPGTPEQLVANAKAAGAGGVLGYVWRPGGVGGWTSQHWSSLRSAGLRAVPIGVPAGDGSTPVSALVAAARAQGFTSGPLVVDMEAPYNLPSMGWWASAISGLHSAGFLAIKYGNAGDVGAYADADGWWLARYLQHTVEPLPAIPAGVLGIQFADEVNLGGVTYDASVFPDSFGGEGGDVTTHADWVAIFRGLYGSYLRRGPEGNPGAHYAWADKMTAPGAVPDQVMIDFFFLANQELARLGIPVSQADIVALVEKVSALASGTGAAAGLSAEQLRQALQQALQGLP